MIDLFSTFYHITLFCTSTETLFLNASPPQSVGDWSFVLSADPGLISDGLADGACPATVEIDQRLLFTANTGIIHCTVVSWPGVMAMSK